MNKLLAGLMTLIVLGTVVVVFGLGALSLTGGIGTTITAPPDNSERKGASAVAEANAMTTELPCLHPNPNCTASQTLQ